MKALILEEYKKLVISDVPEPSIAPSEVLIRVHSCGICGSDVHGYDGSSGRRIPPVIMGHEASGVIAIGGFSRHKIDGVMGVLLPRCRINSML